LVEKNLTKKENKIMATTVTGKLNKAASQFQAGESTGFGLRLGVKFYDRETKAEAYTNYECAVFAKAPAQVQFYQQALVEGAIVEVSGDKLKIRQFQGNNGLSLSIEILDAKLGAVFAPQGQQAPQQQRQSQQPQQHPQQPQQQYNQAPRQAPQSFNQAPQQQPQYQHGMHNGQPAVDFDDDIPF
jgi:single-strand DNA-binding protein